jgi:hypothetical protein
MNRCVRTCTANGHAIETVLAKETNAMSEPIAADLSFIFHNQAPKTSNGFFVRVGENRNGLVVQVDGVDYFCPDSDEDE